MTHQTQGVCGHSNNAGQGDWVILSVDQSPLNINQFVNYLIDTCPFKRTVGCYKGQVEQSFLVPANKLWEIAMAGWIADQESVLYLGACDARGVRPAWLLYSHPERSIIEYVGAFSEQGLGKPTGDYTYDPSTYTYYNISMTAVEAPVPAGLEALLAS